VRRGDPARLAREVAEGGFVYVGQRRLYDLTRRLHLTDGVRVVGVATRLEGAGMLVTGSASIEGVKLSHIDADGGDDGGHLRLKACTVVGPSVIDRMSGQLARCRFYGGLCVRHGAVTMLGGELNCPVWVGFNAALHLEGVTVRGPLVAGYRGGIRLVECRGRTHVIEAQGRAA